jgi:hypothetical protein
MSRSSQTCTSPGAGTARRRARCLAASVLAGLLASCASPGPDDYAAAASRHAEQAREHYALARQHEAAAERLSAQGDSEGAAIATQAADDEARAAGMEQFDADKDSWLSRW